MVLEAATAGRMDPAGIVHGFGTAFWWAVGFTAVAFVLCFALPSRRPL